MWKLSLFLVVFFFHWIRFVFHKSYLLQPFFIITSLCYRTVWQQNPRYQEIKAGEGKGLHCFDKARKITVILNQKNHQPKWALGHRLGGFGPEGDERQAAHWSYSDFCSRLSSAESGFRTCGPGTASQRPDAPSHSTLPPAKSVWFNPYSNLHQ